MTFTVMRLLAVLLLLLSTDTDAELLKKFMMGGNMDKGSGPPQQQEPPAAAMTCDAMMAKSLVVANEATAVAQAERDQFFQDLESMKLTAQELKQELKDTTEDLTQRLFNAKEETATVQKEAKQALEALENKWKVQLEEANNNMALLRDRSEREIYEGQQDTARRLKLQEEQHEAALQQKSDEMEAMKLHYDELAAAVRAEASHNISTIVSQSEAVIGSLKEEHAKQLTLLEEESKATEQKSLEMLETTRNDAAEKLKQQELESKNRLSAVEAEYTAKLDKANEQIKELTKKLKTLEKKRSTLEQKYNAASEEVSRWEQLYGSRSYCNFTYIQEDAVAAAVATQEVVVDHAIKAADKATKATRNLVETSVKKAEPHVQKTKALLQRHVQPLIDKTNAYYKQHMKPHVNKHVTPYAAPFFQKCKILLNRAWVKAKALAKEVHSRLVAGYKASCPKALKRLQKMDHAPKFMINRVKQSCQDADKTINTLLWTCVLLVAFLFRSFLLRTLIGLVLLPFQITWFFCPLRLLFGKKKDAAEDDGSEDETPVASPVKSTRRKKVPPQ